MQREKCLNAYVSLLKRALFTRLPRKINKRLVRHTHTHMRPHHPIQIDRCNVIDKRSNRNGFFMLHSASHFLSPPHPVYVRLISFAIYLFALPVCLFVSQSRSGWCFCFSLFHLDVCFVSSSLCLTHGSVYVYVKISIKTGLSTHELYQQDCKTRHKLS